MNKPLSYIGIDPGAKGAICVLCPERKAIEFMNTTARPIEIIRWLWDVDSAWPTQVAMFEKVHAIHGTSANSNFNFGFNTGLITGIIGTLDCSMDQVTPKVWQKSLGVTVKGKAIKKEVARLVGNLYPAAEIMGPRGGFLDGRSDALAIAHYAWQKWKI